MSRHDLPAHRGNTVVVGWDQPLMTFFAIVKRIGDGEIVEWLGTEPYEIDEIDELVRRVAPYAEIPYGLQMTLYGDKDEGRMD